MVGRFHFSPIVAYIFYAIIAMLYFRIVFGYFSRLFERQADLYVFEAGVPHYYMLQALDYIGVASGNTHLSPAGTTMEFKSVSISFAMLRSIQTLITHIINGSNGASSPIFHYFILSIIYLYLEPQL